MMRIKTFDRRGSIVYTVTVAHIINVTSYLFVLLHENMALPLEYVV